MNSKLIVFLIFSLFCVSKLIEASGGSAEQKSQRDTCGSIVHPEPSSSEELNDDDDDTQGSEGSAGGVVTVIIPCPECEAENETVTWASPSSVGVTLDGEEETVTGQYPTTQKVRRRRCHFTRALWNISLTFSFDIQIKIQKWIIEIETTYLVDVSYSDDYLVYLIGYSFEKFGKDNPDCWDKLKFVKVPGWNGYCIDFVYIAKVIQVEKANIIVELDSDDNCDLFDAIRNATKGDAEAEKECEDLIAELLIILKKSGWSYEQKMAAFHATFQYHLEISVKLKLKLKNCNIKGFGSLESFIDVTLVYERTTTVKTVIEGSNCVLLQELKNAYSDQTLEISVRNQIKQLHDVIFEYFSTTTEINLRLKFVSEKCYSFFGLVEFNAKFVYSIKLGSWGTLYDLNFCSHVCTNHGCGDVNAGPGVDATTESPVKPGDCGKRTSLVTVQADLTYTLVKSIQVEFDKWNSTMRIGFQPYFNQVKQHCGNASLTPDQKVDACAKTLYNYNANSPARRYVVLNSIQIVEWKATVATFVTCTKTITSSS